MMYCQVSLDVDSPKRLETISLNGIATEPKLKFNKMIAISERASIKKVNRYVCCVFRQFRLVEFL